MKNLVKRDGKTAIECCGQEIVYSTFTNTCSRCGTDYNFSGQRLAPRPQWCEETVETTDEILRDMPHQVV
ncbi:MAG: hypothetical protein HQ578_02495 [Chloroflexi bacterium]|nr:hypothetical protein [Chloroflexota bacterium]